MAFSAGSRVAARGLVWDVIGAELLGRQQLLHLRCADGDMRGLTWDLLTPHEQVTPLQADLRPEEVSSLETWRLHHIACLLDQLPGPGVFLAGVPGRVAIEPYQLVPLLRALEMPRPRLLLADGVGLGKTIQAGLIATELIARRRAHRILVVTPAGPLLRQWDEELRQRFGLRCTTLADAASLQVARRRLELGGNPFDACALCLTAIDFAKQERVLEDLERAAWDLVVIDEAHHCTGDPDTEPTQRRRLAEVLARRSDGLLLLTATPHDGHDAHFGSLLALLDPSLVDAAGLPAGSAYRRHVVRRLKQHVSDAAGRPLFQDRQVIPLAVAVPREAQAVRAFHAGLSALVTPRLSRPGPESLAFVSLLKRSVSTLAACVATLRAVAERVGRIDPTAARERTRALRAYRRKLARYGVLDATDEAEVAELEAEDMAVRLATGECTGLRALIRLGETAIGADPKLAALVAEIRTIRALRPRANILVYTEYADSQAAALEALKSGGLSGEIRSIGGHDDEPARSAAADRFTQAEDVILVSTDALAEGLNLHRRCRDLIHLDLPYNPNRLEQRNGRIDRYGQTAVAQIRYLYLAGTFEERLLLRLIAKYEKARAALTFMPDTLGVTADPADWEPALFESFAERQAFEGFAERQASLFDEPPPAVRTLDHTAETLDLDAYRGLRHEIDRAYEGFDRMALRHGWLADQGLQAGAVQVSTASRAHRRGKLLGCVDLAVFVRAAVAADTGVPTHGGLVHLPEPWSAGLEGLAGFDPTRRTLDLHGIGRAHPVVRRAVLRVRRAVPVTAFVGPAITARSGSLRGPVSRAEAVLLTYVAELHDEDGLAWQRVLAVHLPRRGRPEVLPDPAAWMAWGDEARGTPGPRAANSRSGPKSRRGRDQTPLATLAASSHDDRLNAETPCPGHRTRRSAGDDRTSPWRAHFAAWAGPRLPEAEAAAMTVASRLADMFVSDRQTRAAREAAALIDWMGRRADALCGRAEKRTRDLFADEPPGLDWRSETEPTRRLALYAADPATPQDRRHTANELIGLFTDRARQRARQLSLRPPSLRPLGLLMRTA